MVEAQISTHFYAHEQNARNMPLFLLSVSCVYRNVRLLIERAPGPLTAFVCLMQPFEYLGNCKIPAW